jgi:hypothetical protein
MILMACSASQAELGQLSDKVSRDLILATFVKNLSEEVFDLVATSFSEMEILGRDGYIAVSKLISYKRKRQTVIQTDGAVCVAK